MVVRVFSVALVVLVALGEAFSSVSVDQIERRLDVDLTRLLAAFLLGLFAWTIMHGGMS